MKIKREEKVGYNLDTNQEGIIVSSVETGLNPGGSNFSSKNGGQHMADGKELAESSKASIGAGVGAIVGAATSAATGEMGLAVAGLAMAPGIIPVLLGGAIAGVAVYGVGKVTGHW